MGKNTKILQWQPSLVTRTSQNSHYYETQTDHSTVRSQKVRVVMKLNTLRLVCRITCGDVSSGSLSSLSSTTSSSSSSSSPSLSTPRAVVRSTPPPPDWSMAELHPHRYTWPEFHHQHHYRVLKCIPEFASNTGMCLIQSALQNRVNYYLIWTWSQIQLIDRIPASFCH